MTIFEKTILPLILNITPDDIKCNSGFIDTYTYDPDRPYDYRAFYIVIDDSIRSEESISLARKLHTETSFAGTYVKYISGNPYVIYRFVLPANFCKKKDNWIELSPEDKCKVITTYGIMDEVSKVLLASPYILVNDTHSLPLEDELENPFHKFYT